MLAFDGESEWLEADGLGGFASGPADGIRTRRYHGLLLVAQTPPTGRVMLVNGFEAWVETAQGRYPITSQHYWPDVVYPEGSHYIESFLREPWPRWVYKLPDGTRLEQEIFNPKGSALTVIAWKLLSKPEGAKLTVRPFISGRDYHSMHHQNDGFRFDADLDGNRVTWRPYANLPSIHAISNATYQHAPQWYRNFRYDQEVDRGFEETEDLGAPGILEFDLSKPALLFLTTDDSAVDSVEKTYQEIRAAELKRRQAFPTRLHKAADAYIVQRGEGKTIIAGYPWFTDWGRDTFIALRGLCLAGGRLSEAQGILTEWAGAVSEGMLPNLFVDKGGVPEFNAVDASLWYIIAVHDFLEAAEVANQPVTEEVRSKLQDAVEQILIGYERGTRYRIKADADGLLMAGEPGVQLTWMDAKVGDYVVTPRIGKPVEVQALWLNALKVGSFWNNHWGQLYDKAAKSFQRFWNPAGGYLYDVVDADHVAGNNDASFRPNQIFAVGGLPFQVLEGERARAVVQAVEERLLTPLGLRSLAPEAPGYRGHYGGNVYERDTAYHQGTVWPWLMGAFVEAWVRVRGNTPEAKQEARERFLKPLLAHLDSAGLGHISEIADGDAPYKPDGCPFQAWSVGEALRLEQQVLRDSTSKPQELIT